MLQRTKMCNVHTMFLVRFFFESIQVVKLLLKVEKIFVGKIKKNHAIEILKKPKCKNAMRKTKDFF